MTDARSAAYGLTSRPPRTGGRGHNLCPPTEHSERSWGTYGVLLEAAGYKVETITVKPGQRLSYQRHQYRAEYRFIVSGERIATLDGYRPATQWM
ncbi:cupin domain-containing protein [Nocardia sp. X0981]